MPGVQLCGPSRHDLGQLIDDLVGLAMLDHLVEVGVPVKVIEVL
jgi:hypothetical protein